MGRIMWWKCNKIKKINAYFSVEAALVFPFVLGVVLLVIYLLFYQYDRCLMEQSTAVLALRGCSLQTVDAKKLVAELVLQCRNEDKPYVAWEMSEVQIKIKGKEVSVMRRGKLKFPFMGFNFWAGEDSWWCTAGYETHRIKPVSFIRNYKKWEEHKC